MSFPFGQHFVCECCGRKTQVKITGLRKVASEPPFFIQPLCISANQWYVQVELLKGTGEWQEATLCGKCGKED